MKKRKIKFKSFLLLFLIIFCFVFLGNKLSFKKENIIDENIVLVGKKLNELTDYFNKNNIIVEKKYEYSVEVLPDIIISGEIIDNKASIVISKGKIDDSVLSEYKVNELGNVPIMMYHGIIDTVDNKYIGGNVDKDGYNRTAKAFREDLEFYYKNGYRMVRLIDYANGFIDVSLGYSPIILTFDDGNQNNFNVLGRNSDGSLEIDPNCAVGILEEFKSKYPDFNVTATFFVMNDLFNQKEYNQDILNYLVDHGYDIGNHTTSHPDFTKIDINKSQEVVGKMYQKLDSLLGNKYIKAVALPFGSPYKKTHENFSYIAKGNYNGYNYETEVLLRVGWEPEVSPFNKNFDKQFLKRCRAYDNNGKEFDIEMVFKNLEKNKFISDGDPDIISIPSSMQSNINDNLENIHIYGGN